MACPCDDCLTEIPIAQDKPPARFLRASKALYFHTLLSASQRWPLNSFASAATEPLSSFGSPPSSSPVDSSDRFSLGPVPSSDVVITGLEIHSISLSDAPGLSGETSAVTSTFSVRPIGG